MKILPEDVTAFKRTPDFDESSMPAGLRRAHRTVEGVWGRIVVLAGRLRYTIDADGTTPGGPETVILDEHVHGVVEPTVPHEVEPLGEVRFYVEFHR